MNIICLAIPTPTVMTHEVISVGAMMRTADGWTSWLWKPAGRL